MSDSNDKFNLESFVSKDGMVFLKLTNAGEVVGGGFFPLGAYREFYGSLEIILTKLIAAGLAEPLAYDLDKVPDGGEIRWN